MVLAALPTYILLTSFRAVLSSAETWPYDRYHGCVLDSGAVKVNNSHPEYKHEPPNHFLDWFHSIVKNDTTGRLESIFTNGTVPLEINHFDDLIDYFNIPDAAQFDNHTTSGLQIPNAPWAEATRVFNHLGFDLDPRCTSDRGKWWYRNYDGCECPVPVRFHSRKMSIRSLPV